MQKVKTAERVSQDELSDNYVFQRSLLAYIEASKIISGDILEIGCGEGYAMEIIAPKVNKYYAIDKHQLSSDKQLKFPNVKYISSKVPPLKNISDNFFDYVITFQVIEHIEDDALFLSEIYRVLKDKGKLIVTTPNRLMSLTRNPWHVREYTVEELEKLLCKYFQNVEKRGVYGNEKIMQYYENNKKSVEKITKYDIFNLQYNLPRSFLQIPYDILNRRNRKKLLEQDNQLVKSITLADYFIAEADNTCFDLFYVAEKRLIH